MIGMLVSMVTGMAMAQAAPAEPVEYTATFAEDGSGGYELVEICDVAGACFVPDLTQVSVSFEPRHIVFVVWYEAEAYDWVNCRPESDPGELTCDWVTRRSPRRIFIGGLSCSG